MTASAITGLVLAGGLGSRMGGADKGLQTFDGEALAARALRRLRPQVGALALNANRHLDRYAALGAPGLPVWPDADGSFAGPLSGMLAGLHHCTTPWLATVPCDAPHFPADLVARLAAAADAAGSLLAHALGPDDDGQLRPQPVFALLHASLRDDLATFLAGGGRKVGAWMAVHRPAVARFDASGDDPGAFANVNTFDQLGALERHDR